ncbi:sugar ABC transporter ATP-binding protein [Oceanicella sp. SM1341]|uniref:sugar ABC transporter ATP-binding protein n=1 Tax=Oceanicella sp. SM1341 TaxID=1548889 RepID=UPI000E48DAD8|nr:sugar ABC transporter ATP-binding protein [Oceanicella sp. SM1341]
MSAPALALAGVSRSFGPVEVLHGVDIALRPGRVHALIGENGAGKSTTMKILAGYLAPSRGELRVAGTPARFASVREAEAAGIVLIHQEFNLAEQLTVEQNLFLGREIRRGWLLDKPAMRARARALLDRLSCAAGVDRVVSSLSNSDKQMLEIAKALAREARVLIMDEPTAVLTRAETDILLTQVRALRAAGTAVLFTSHKLDEVREIADDLTIMRDGAVVWQGEAAGMSEHDMAEAMVGREVSGLYPAKPPAPGGAPVLEVEGLDVPGHAEGVSFGLRAGEILGVAGLIGSGRTETFEGLCGLRPARGRIRLDGREVRVRSPAEAKALGLGYLTEDRKTRGLLLTKSLRENLTLTALERFARLTIDTAAEERALDTAIAEFDIRAGARDGPVGNLSGGNQQKLLLARTLLPEPRIVVIDEPTRGIDIGTRQQIYRFIRELAASGRSIVVISSEMQEVIGLADRVLVMCRGRVAGTLEGADITEAQIVRLAMGLGAPAPAAEEPA